MMTLNGKQLDLTYDATNADDVERAEKAQEHFSAREKELAEKGELKRSEWLRFQCNTIFDYFDIIFGDGTHKLIFGDQTSLELCMNTLMEFATESSQNTTRLINVASQYMASRLDRKKK